MCAELNCSELLVARGEKIFNAGKGWLVGGCVHVDLYGCPPLPSCEDVVLQGRWKRCGVGGFWVCVACLFGCDNGP